MAKITKINHVAIAVPDLDASLSFWRDALGLTLDHVEDVPSQKSMVAFIPCGDSEVELLESTSPDGPIAKFIEKKGEGIQHLAFRVDNLEAALASLKEQGVRMIDEKPRYGAGGASIAFVHPKATGSVLVELSERK